MGCRFGLNQAIGRFDPSRIREAFARGNSIPGIIPLAIGEPDLPMPDLIKWWMRNAIQQDLTRYTPTEGLWELRQKVLGQYLEYDFAQASLITAGVSGAIDLLCRVLLEPGREVIIIEPFFPMYLSQTLYMGATPVIVPTTGNHRISLPTLEAAVTNRTVAIFVNSPNNPTGGVYSSGEIADIAMVANKHRLLVISDDIYGSLVYDNCPLPNFIGLAENLIVLDGWSKNYSLTGSRIGYAVGPKWIIEAMAKAQQFSYVCANTVAQWAVLKCWGMIDLSERTRIFQERRDLVEKMLRPQFKLSRLQGAFYALVQMPPGITGTEFTNECLKHNVLVVPSGGTFTRADNAVRISYALPMELLQRGLEGMIAAKHALRPSPTK